MLLFTFADYSCALQRDILVHGRLYISQNWLCFYANIFGWETFVSMRYAELPTLFSLPNNSINVNLISQKNNLENFIYFLILSLVNLT